MNNYLILHYATFIFGLCPPAERPLQIPAMVGSKGKSDERSGGPVASH
jgi:hypothetical protein